MDIDQEAPGTLPAARDRLIDAAVRHFADHGFKGASLRAIQRDAGVNPASAHYYFGSKEALFQAVVDTFIHDIQKERVRRYRTRNLGASGSTSLIGLLRDYFEPGIAVARTESGFAYAKILARVQASAPGSAQTIFYEVVGPVRSLYLDALQTFFPQTTRYLLNRYLAMGVALMANEAVRLGTTGGDFDVTSPAEEVARFVAAGFEALLGPAA